MPDRATEKVRVAHLSLWPKHPGKQQEGGDLLWLMVSEGSILNLGKSQQRWAFVAEELHLLVD